MAYMSTAPAGFFTVGCKDIAILFDKVRRKTQFCHNGSVKTHFFNYRKNSIAIYH